METGSNEIARDFPPFLRIYKDGRVERLLGTATVPASDPDPATGVSSKDVLISPSAGVTARLYLPNQPPTTHKLPILLFFHGGGFCIESASSPTYHLYLNSLSAAARLLIVSVNYRLAPEHPLPAAYDDSWLALQWAASGGSGDPWLAEHGDFSRLNVAGDSAGANIAHHMAMRAGGGDIPICSAVLLHPYFWGAEPVGKEPKEAPHRGMIEGMWKFVCPETSGCDDPMINPLAAGAGGLAGMGCRRVLVVVAEKDLLKERGWAYYRALAASGWEGVAEMMETEGEDHVFFLFKPTCEQAGALMKRVVDFFNLEAGSAPGPRARAPLL